jgi:hypothetical protein
MTRQTLVVRLFALAVLAQILGTTQAHAYIDPGSGSFFVQMLLAGLLGAGMAIKAYWHRIKAFFTGGKKTTPPGEDESPDS